MKIFFSWTGKSKHVKYFILLAFSSPVSSLMKWGRKGFLPVSRRTQNWSGFKAGIHVLIKTSSLAPSFSVLLDSFSICRRWKTASTEESGSVAEVKRWLILAVQAADYYLGRVWPGWNPLWKDQQAPRVKTISAGHRQHLQTPYPFVHLLLWVQAVCMVVFWAQQPVVELLFWHILKPRVTWIHMAGKATKKKSKVLLLVFLHFNIFEDSPGPRRIKSDF